MNNKKQEARAEGLRKGIKRNKRISKPGGVKGKEEKDKKKRKDNKDRTTRSKNTQGKHKRKREKIHIDIQKYKKMNERKKNRRRGI